MFPKGVRPRRDNNLPQTRSQSIAKARPDENYHFCMGTQKSVCDVINNDEVQTAWNGPINPDVVTIPAEQLFQAFYINTDPVEGGPDLIFIETPVGTSLDTEVAEITVTTNSRWAGLAQVPIKSVAMMNPFGFTVQFNCQKAGTAKIVIQTRLIALYNSKDNARTRKDINQLEFKKECKEVGAGLAADAHPGARANVILGFQVTDKDSGEIIIKDGMPDEKYTAGSKTLVVVPPKQDVYVTSVILPKGLTLRPVYHTVADESIVTMKLTSAKPNELALTFQCWKTGQTEISVVFAFDGPHSAQSMMTLNKKCSMGDGDDQEKAPVSGFSMTGFTIGTKEGESNVVLDGIVNPAFATNADGTKFEMEESRHTYKKETTIVKFHLSLSGDAKIRLRKPQVMELRAEDAESIMNPELEYDKPEMRAFAESKYFVATLKFSCFKAGQTKVLMTFPTNKGTFEVIIQKECVDDASKEAVDQQVTIPGFYVGMSPDSPNVVQNGKPVINFDWIAAGKFPGMGYHFYPKDAYVTFFIGVGSVNAGADTEEKEDDESDENIARVNFTAPELIVSSDISEAELTGPASEGAVLDADRRLTRLSVTFHCTRPGIVILSVVLPMVEYDSTAVGPQRLSDVKFSFIKECGDADGHAGNGGVGMTGFSIGTEEGGNDVVYNGFPRPSYYGQRTRAKPAWDDIIVGPEKVSISLYLSYRAEEEQEISKGDERSMAFGKPMLAVDSNVVKAELSGEAAEGGVLVMDDEDESELELDVTFECYYKGLAAVTVLIPIIPHGVITLTIPKQCEGKNAPEGVRVSGLDVGTTQGGKDVVASGFTTNDFKKGGAGTSFVTHDNETIFYITNGGRPFVATEPLIFAHKPICNPKVHHDLTSNDEGSDSIVIPNGASTMTVTYNCILYEKVSVTLVIPLPTGNIRWTWVQNCGSQWDEDREDFDWVDYDLYDEMDNDDYYDFFIDVPDTEDDYGDVFDDYTTTDYDYDYFWGDYDQDCAGCTGTLNVGTAADKLDDVVDRGMARPRFSIAGDSSDSNTPYHIVDRLTLKSTFFVSTPATNNKGTLQAFFPIQVKAGKKKSGAQIARPTIEGDIAAGGKVEVDGEAQRFTISFNCIEGQTGVTSVLVSIPLDPPNRGSVTFRIMKMCGKFEIVEAFYWTANRILILIGSLLSVCLCVGIVIIVKNMNTVQYQMLPTSEKGTAKKGGKEVQHGIEMLDPNVDDSD